MQDLGQDNYIVMNERAQGARAGNAASTRIQVQAERELCRELVMAFTGRVTAIVYFRPLQFGVSAKNSIYRHNAYSCIVSRKARNLSIETM